MHFNRLVLDWPDSTVDFEIIKPVVGGFCWRMGVMGGGERGSE